MIRFAVWLEARVVSIFVFRMELAAHGCRADDNKIHREKRHATREWNGITQPMPNLRFFGEHPPVQLVVNDGALSCKALA